MKKSLLIMVISVLVGWVGLLQAADLEALKVDFGLSSSPVQSGYAAYTAADKNLTSFTTQSYTVFGTTVSVLLQWTPPVTAATARAVNRGAQSYEDATEPLMQDWVGTDLRPGNTGDPLVLTITGLPAGTYAWISYHHDTGTSATVGSADVTVTDAAGSSTTLDIRCTNNSVTTFNAVRKFETVITSDGIHPVSIVFDLRPYTNQWNECFFVINGFNLIRQFIRGGATDPVPLVGAPAVDSEVTTAVSWTAPQDPNLVSITGYDVYFGTDPNVILNPKTFVTAASMPVTLTYNTKYYWRVDARVVWDSIEVTGKINDTVEGFVWFFTTLPDDLTPVVACGNDVLTARQLLPATLTGTVDDLGEGDMASITWEVLVPAAAKRMINRTAAQDLAALEQITSDPSLLRDWIGADTRDEKVSANPLRLTLKGLPAGTYSWTSYHHDAQNQHGAFDVTVYDASVSSPTTTRNIGITNASTTPIGTFTTPIVSNGTDVIIEFQLHHWGQVGSAAYYNESFLVINGFELTKDADSLKIDFGPVGGDTLAGFAAYEATTQQPESFTEQSYSVFGTTVSVLPTWGGIAVVTDRTNNPSSSTQQAEFTTDRPGNYTIQFSAADQAGQIGTDTMVVTVAENTCAAAQQSKSWTGFSTYDLNTDCMVDLGDLAIFAGQWLNDRNLAGQE